MDTSADHAKTVELPKVTKPFFPLHVRGYEISGKRFALILAITIIVIIVVAVGFSTDWTFKNKDGFIESFSLWGTPDWEIRDKGHKHQERSDSHVSKPKNTDKNWSISAFKKSVRELNRKARN